MPHNLVFSSSPGLTIPGEPCALSHGDLGPGTAGDEANQAVQQGIFARDEGDECY